MTNTVLEFSVSIDGFATGPDVDMDTPMGVEGERLHAWMDEAADAPFARRPLDRAGAFLLGRRMFDLGERPWGEDGTFRRPCFVVTGRPKEMLVKGPTTFTFVTDGFTRAVELAREAAGERDLVIMGGPAIAQQALAAGIVDEIRLHLVPLLLGAGTRLFEPAGRALVGLELTECVHTPAAVHLTYRRP
ncbi:dihydrofolate reductase family protein [Herbihabitans rhizosphaerae]|nr:dihydrofolate reductase family protein [Herbihabitans rhizosphaerae]